MRSMVSWALLGIVIERPSYGYELAVRFERTYAEALEISNRSHIYSALDSLTRRRLIEIEEETGTQDTIEVEAASGGRHPKAHYRATAEGVRSHREWLVSQLKAERERSRLFGIQLAMLPPRAALEVIERYEQTALHNGAQNAPNTKESEDLAERLVAEEERLAVDARLAWVAYARRELRALVKDPTSK
jgi:DNA-binding PadR family transcriptional regulator